MLVEQKPELQSSVETLYRPNYDEQLRETIDRFVRAQRREQGYLDTIAEQRERISALEQEIATRKAAIAALRAEQEALQSLKKGQ